MIVAAVAAIALNDTFPDPSGLVGALLVWGITIAAVVWTVKLIGRRQAVPWPSAITIVSIFVVSLILVILADTRGIGDIVGPPSMLILFPAMMLAGPFALSSPTAAGSRASGLEHLGVAIAAAVFWSFAIVLVRMLMRRPDEESANSTDG
jgi:hypothetical protein